MSKLDKLKALCGNTFDSIEDFLKKVKEIWKGDHIEIAHLYNIIVLNIDTEESEYRAIYREIENKKIIFKELREVE